MNTQHRTHWRSQALTVSLVLLLAGAGAYFFLPRWSTHPTISIVQNSGYRTRIERPERITTGRSVPLIVHVHRGEENVDLREDRKMLHLIIASEDGEDLFHTYSHKEIGKGLYEFPHFFTRTGRYRIWTEIGGQGNEAHHGEEADLIAYDAFTVTGDPVLNVNTSARGQQSSSEAYIMLVEPKNLVAGKAVTLRISVMDAQGKKFRLSPDEGADYALTGATPELFSHGHLKTTADGQFVELPITFPSPGTYGLWVDAFPFVGDFVESVVFRFILAVR